MGQRDGAKHYGLRRWQEALKITIATYWRPSGQNIHRLTDDREKDKDGEWGVKPSEGFEVPMTKDQRRDFYRWRRERDVIRSTSTSDDVSAKKPSPDLPLNRAIEYLREKLDGSKTQAAS